MTTLAEQSNPSGQTSLEPAGKVAAGVYGSWQLIYQAGSQGIPAGGRIRVYTDSDTDWEVPQVTDPAGPDYVTVDTPPGVGINIVALKPWGLLLQLRGRRLEPGEEIAITFGDQRGGGPGTRPQTFVEERHYFHVAVDPQGVAVDPQGVGNSETVPDSPSVSIVGDVVDHLLVVAPSTVTVGTPFRIQIQAKDRWGNPAAYRGTVTLTAAGVQLPHSQLTFSPEDGGVRWIEGCVATEAGTLAIVATDTPQDLSATSNPILSTTDAPEYTLFWGDFHGGQIADSSKIDDFFRHARDIAAIDFTSYQRNDHAISGLDWERQQAAERAYHQPGRFVSIPGFEWSGMIPAGGHHNVFFRRHGQPVRRNSHSAVEDKSDIDTDLPHVLDLYRTYRNADVVITPHVGGDEADLDYHEPTLEPAIEVVSTHGSFEWFLEDALRRGYKVGFLGGSDSHTGRPGDDRPGYQFRRFTKAGLAGVYATELTLDSILEALSARRCYATTGARILAHVHADGHPLGEEYRTDQPPTISCSVTGTAPLESVELYRGLECIYRHPLSVPVVEKRVRILWEGASRRTCYTAVAWDGRLWVDGGQFSVARQLRFDSPRSHVYDVTLDSLRWYSLTCGYHSGLILDLDGGDEMTLHLALDTAVTTFPLLGGRGDAGPRKISYAEAESMATTITLQELAQGPQSFDLGILNRKVTVSLAPADDAPHSTEFTFVDPSPEPGVNPYWVRVKQTDMEMAWTSPVFVDYIAPAQ